MHQVNHCWWSIIDKAAYSCLPEFRTTDGSKESLDLVFQYRTSINRGCKDEVVRGNRGRFPTFRRNRRTLESDAMNVGGEEGNSDEPLFMPSQASDDGPHSFVDPISLV